LNYGEKSYMLAGMESLNMEEGRTIMDISLPDLPGFETAPALKMLNNSLKLYTSVLKRFHKQYAGNYASLTETMRGADWEAIQREAHTVKGLAGTIGHPGLQEAAKNLELSVKDVASPDPAALAPLVDEFLASLAEVLDTLKTAFPE
jgi:HPt (histidine-containing phosphotransfer) domain-containing protein